MKTIANHVQSKKDFIRFRHKWDVREDGLVFESYQTRGDKVYERWATPEKLKERSKKSNEAGCEWAKRPEVRARHRVQQRKNMSVYRKLVPEQFMLIAARSRAKAKNIPFNLLLEDVVIPKLCPVLGIPLILGNGGTSDNSPTLDRIIPELGYIKGNIAVISWRANRIKSNATPAEIFKVWQYASSQF